MGEVHLGICGSHQAGINMRWLIRKVWLLLTGHIERLHGVREKFFGLPEAWAYSKTAINMKPIVKPWPFRGWAFDFIGKIGSMVQNFAYAYKIQLTNSTDILAQANGQAEAVNKGLIGRMEKRQRR